MTLGVVAARAPQSPYLVVTWPKPKVPQVLAPDQTVLARGGQPFVVAVTDVEKWEVVWKSGSAEQQGGQFNWAPAEGKEQLIAQCRPLAEGWQSYFSWVWPTRRVTLSSASATSGGNYARALGTNQDGVWIYPHIFAVGNVTWDERALPLLAQSADALPAVALATQTASLRAQPTEALWRIVSNFEGEAQAPSTNGTFVSLHAPDLENALPTIAARLVKQAPKASVKFVLRLDRDPQQGIIRLAFDGKPERQAWVRRAGNTKGQPFTGWENGEFTPKK